MNTHSLQCPDIEIQIHPSFMSNLVLNFIISIRTDQFCFVVEISDLKKRKGIHDPPHPSPPPYPMFCCSDVYNIMWFTGQMFQCDVTNVLYCCEVCCVETIMALDWHYGRETFVTDGAKFAYDAM